MENPTGSHTELVQLFWQTIHRQLVRTPHLAPWVLRQSRLLLARFEQTYQALCQWPRPIRRAWQRRWGASLAGVALAMTLSQTLLYAAEIPVTTTIPDINSDGDCALIEAILNANDDAATYADCAEGSGDDTIVLPPASLHTLSTPYDPDGLLGLPPITSTITISGNDATIERVSDDFFSIFLVEASGDLTLEETTITGGYAINGSGGAIYNSAGAISLYGSTIFSNTAVFGGGILNMSGQVNATNSFINGNRAEVFGGGIFNVAGGVTLTSSTVQSNTAFLGGGSGITNIGSLGPVDPPEVQSASQAAAQALWAQWEGRAVLTDTAEVALVDTVVISNTTEGSGGGILNLGGILSLTASTVATNTAECCGGGLSSDLGSVTIADSTFVNNTAYTYGGGMSLTESLVTIARSTIQHNTAGYAGGGIESDDSLTMVTDSTIHANQVITGYGGGLSLYWGSLALTNTTISGNSAEGGGGGIAAEGDDALLTVADSTLTGNSTSGTGGGLLMADTSSLALARTLVSGNTAGTDGNELYATATTTVDETTFNLFGHSGQNTAQALVGFTPDATDLIATSDGTIPTLLTSIVDPTLADNGGTTPTHALVVGSPAIDAAGITGPAADQRGVTRPQGLAFDIGAVEIESGLLNSQLSQVSLSKISATTTPDSTYPAQSTQGVLIAALTLKNNGDPVSNVYYQVTSLNNGNWLLNADGGPGQVGSTLSVPNSSLPGGDSLWNQTENLTQNLTFGMMVASTLSFRVDVYGVPPVVASDVASPLWLGSYTFTLDPNPPTNGAFRLFLPTVRQ